MKIHLWCIRCATPLTVYDGYDTCDACLRADAADMKIDQIKEDNDGSDS